MNSILPGGCYPQPYPPVEPEPDSLDEPVDWMTYSHQELYRMVHQGLDLAGATRVSADWARLGEALGEIGDALNRIDQAFAQAWQGEAADQARHAVTSLATWAEETGAGATEVSGCITVEVDNAIRARDAMPAPLPAFQPDPREPAPMPANPFAEPGFESASLLVSDQNALVNQQYQAHRQAAETMERFQADSREVYYTVPQFSAPKIGPKPPGEDNPPPPDQTTPSQTGGEPAGPGRGVGGLVPVGGGGGSPVATPPPGPAPAPRPTPGPGGAGPAPGEGATQSRPAAAASPGRPGGGAPVGGMPMGGVGGGRGGEDHERKSPPYIKEDKDIWGLRDHVVAPPVIGEDGERA